MEQFNKIELCLIIKVDGLCHITNTSTGSQAFIKHTNIALEHGKTIVLADNIGIIAVDIVIIHLILNVEEGHGCEDIDNEHEKQECQVKLIQVESNRLDNVL